MLKKGFLFFAVLILLPSFALSEIIDVKIKGVDDGVKTTKQQDYKEAVLFAKREAIERAGVKVKALTTAKDFVIHSDYIESKAEAALLPGYDIIDVGYQQDGTYLVILIGKVKAEVYDSTPKEIATNVRFIKNADGVVFDKKTGLEWYAGPDTFINWYEAKAWAESLYVSGGGWRMPTSTELKMLYQKGVGTRNMTPLLTTTGWWVWSGEIRGLSSYAQTFNFYKEGHVGLWGMKHNSNHGRAFAVRSRK